jgi:hypothetical protein
MKIDVDVKSNAKQVKEEARNAVLAALEAIGQQAVSHAKNYLKEAGRIDTGLLRNSITYALSGQPPNVSSYTASNASKYGGRTGILNGSYKGNAPNDPENQKAVYIGTNVEYAPYVEAGTDRMAATHYLQRAVTEHSDEYKRIAEQYMKK